MPGLTHIRSQSLFGLSDVKCYFNWDTKYADARQEVINRLQFVQLPNGNQATLSPWNAIGEVYRYTLEGKGYSLSELKAAEDWILERQFKQVPGVVDVTSYGGETKQYQIDVDPFRLRGHGVTLQQLITGGAERQHRTSAGSGSPWASSRSTCAASASSAGATRWATRSTTSRTSSSSSRRACPSASATSPRSTSGTRRASAWWARTTRTTSSRASCSCATAARRPRP